jgi:hypothetical protein
MNWLKTNSLSSKHPLSEQPDFVDNQSILTHIRDGINTIPAFNIRSSPAPVLTFRANFSGCFFGLPLGSSKND